MNIACVIHSLNGGGAERVMAGLASRLAERGHRLTLLTLDDGAADRHPVDPRVQRVCLDVMGTSRTTVDALANNAGRLRRLRRALLAADPQVVLSFCDTTNILTLAATVGSRLPVVVSERSDPRFQPLPWAWRQARPWMYRRAAALVALTPTAATAMESWHRRPPLVIPSAVDAPPQPPPQTGAPGRRSDRRTLLGVGRLAVEKGFDRLIDAFAAVAGHRGEWDLTIAGEGPERAHLEAQVQRVGLVGRVRFAGWVQPIWPLLYQADLFALTSRHEGFPSALLEAMAAGVAVLAMDCESGPRQIIQPGVDGWLVDNDDDLRPLVAALDRLTGDDALRERMAAAAPGVLERFGWTAMVDAYEHLLHCVARSPASRRTAPGGAAP